MRRSFRSTTALAAALALMAPAALLAETALAPKAAAAMDAAARADQPKRAAALDRELAQGLGPDGLTCLGDAPRPCPDGQALVTPKGLAVHLARNGSIVLAPRDDQRQVAQAAAGGGEPAKREPRKAEAAKAPAAAAGEKGNERAAERREKGEAKAAREQSKAEAKAERQAAKAERQAEQQAKAERQTAKAARDDAPAPRQPDADALAASLALAAGRDDPSVVLAQAETPAAEPVPLPEAAAATPPVERMEQPEDVAPPAEAAGQPPAPEPLAERSQPIPAPDPQVAPAVEDPAPRAERSEPLPEPRPVAQEPVVAEPVPEQPRPVGKPQDAPAVAEPAQTAEPRPQAAPRPPVVAEPAAETAPDARPKRAADPVVAEPQDAPKPDAGKGGTPDAAALAAALAAAAGGKAPAEAAPAAAAAAAATGQAEAPTRVEVDEAATRSMEEALQKAADARKPAADRAQKAQKAGQQAATEAGATPADASAAAAAAGSPPVVAEALEAPARISKDATAVVVTEGSARSSSEDFTTRVTEGLTREQQLQLQRLQEQIAAREQQDQPVVVGDGTEASDNDDDDNTERDLARMLLAGVGGYVLANVLANNGQIALSTPDRMVVQQPDGTQSIIKDDNALLLQPGARVTTEDFADGSSRTIVTREDGSRVVTIRDANLRVLRRTLIGADGTVTELIDDAAPVDPVVVTDLAPAARPVDLSGQVDEDALRAALAQEATIDRRFSLGQIRNIPEVRGLVAPIEIDAITFETGSAAISPDQAQQLATLGKVISDYVRTNPGEMFLIEGHTDTVGSSAMNLALSDRRAESIALALTQYFQVPPENMVVQGYGEQHLKVNQEGDIRANRRASVRRITDLLARS